MHTTQSHELTDDGVTDSPLAVPYRVNVTHPVAAVISLTQHLDHGETSDDTVCVAGRIRARRDVGGLLFIDVEDRSGRAQVMADMATTDHFGELTARNIGDWVALAGRVGRSRSGEPSLVADNWQLLASCHLSFPSTTHELTNTDQRWRQRYVDMWATDGARNRLESRSRITSALRAELAADGYLEVGTPVLQPLHGGANARPFTTHHHALDCELTLRIAPELYLKRLVVAGFERVCEFGRVFRNEGLSTRHNPEFEMVEIYRAYADHTDMMDLTERLVCSAAMAANGRSDIDWQGHHLELGEPWRRATMRELVAEHTGTDIGPHLEGPRAAQVAVDLGVEVPENCSWGVALAEIFDRQVERNIIEPTFVCEHPVEVSPLARRHRTNPDVTERFEVIIAGRELCNAFTELVDPHDQYERLAEQARSAAAGDPEAMQLDLDYIRALAYGLPPTAGLGIGIDRLTMLLTDTDNIRDVIAFPSVRPAPVEDRHLDALLGRTDLGSTLEATQAHPTQRETP